MQKHSWLFEKIGKYLIAAVIVIVPLFPKFPLFGVSGTYVAIRFEDLVLLVLGIVVAIKILLNFSYWLKDKIIYSLFIFFVVGLVSLLSAAFVTQTVDFKIGLLHLLRRIEYAVPFLAAITLLSKERALEHLNFFFKLIMIVALVAFVYGFGQRYFRFPIIITQNEEYSKGVALFWTPGSHINSTFAGHYDEAAVMVMFLTFFISAMFVFKDKISKMLLLVSTASSLWLLINSLSRIAQVSYLLSVGISLFLLKKYKAMFMVLSVSIVLIGMSSSLGTRFSRIFQVFYQKIKPSNLTFIIPHFEVSAADSTVLPQKRVNEEPVVIPETPVFEDRSTSIRLNVEWPRAIRAFKKNFLVGTGYSSINLATDNDYLRLLGEVGIIGFFAFALLYFAIFSEILTVFPIKNSYPEIYVSYMFSVVGLSVGTFVSAFFLDLFEASKFATLYWFVLGMAIYLVRSKNYIKNV